MKLYEIDLNILNTLSLYEDGELDESTSDLLDAMRMDRVAKIDAICRVIRTHEARATALGTEADRLVEAISTETRRVRWLKDYLLRSMLTMSERKMETPLFKLWVQKNGMPTITTPDADKLPERFRRVHIEVDKQKLLDVWKAAGPEGDWVLAELGCDVDFGVHLRIK